jgi:hypothetical protein
VVPGAVWVGGGGSERGRQIGRVSEARRWLEAAGRVAKGRDAACCLPQ